MRRLLALALCFMMFLIGCSGKSPARTPEIIRSEGVLRVAAGDGVYPYLYWEDGQAMGIEAGVVGSVALALGVELEFTYAANAAAAAAEGLADVGIACFEQGRVRGKLAETTSYYTRRAFVLTRRGEAYPNQAAMSGRVVLSDSIYAADFAEAVGLDDGVERLMNGVADVMICEEYAALAAVDASGGELQAEACADWEEYRLVAVVSRQNPELFEFVEDEISRMLASGEVYAFARERK